MPYSMFGWDLSGWDDPINWVKVKASCVKLAFVPSFCWVKITEGTSYLSPVWASQWTGLKTINPDVLLATYHYILPLQDGKAQALWFLANYSKDHWGTMPDAVDCEDPGLPDGAPTSMQLTAAHNIWTYVDTYEQATGKRLVNYTNNAWWSKIAYQAEAIKVARATDFWGAEYHWIGGNPPVLPYGYDKVKGWTAWQFTSQQFIDGIGWNGLTDETVFNGDLAALKAWAKALISGGGEPVLTLEQKVDVVYKWYLATNPKVAVA